MRSSITVLLAVVCMFFASCGNLSNPSIVTQASTDAIAVDTNATFNVITTCYNTDMLVGSPLYIWTNGIEENRNGYTIFFSNDSARTTTNRYKYGTKLIADVVTKTWSHRFTTLIVTNDTTWIVNK